MMKIKAAILLFLLISFSSMAQNFTISTVSNTIYKSLPNPLEIVVEGKKCSKIVVITNNGTITHDRDCRYNITPDRTGEATIAIFKRNGKLIGQRYFRVKERPVQAYVMGMTDKHISEPIVFSHSIGLNTMWKEAICSDYDQSKLHYEVMIVKKSGSVIKLKSEDNRFTPEMRENFAKMETGDVVVFHEIIFTLLPEPQKVDDLVLEVN